jgi:hypothetical protein
MNHKSNLVGWAAAFGLLICATAASAAASAAPPRLQPLLQGKWPEHTRGYAYDVMVVGNRAYLALGFGGLVILDVSDPASPVPLAECNTSGQA